MATQTTHDEPVHVAGHFGEWLQGRLGADGPVALVTVRCPVLEARVVPCGQGGSSVFPDDKLARFAQALGVENPAWPDVQCDMPLGAGAGASTATLIAMARAVGFDRSPQDLAEACLEVEGASDPLMFPEPDRLLWASRSAQALQQLPSPPSCDVLAGYWGAPERTDPTDQNFPDVSDLVESWREAVQQQDLAKTAMVASLSAERCAELRGGSNPMATLSNDLGASGYLRAHTGSARGLIFAPGQIPHHGAQAMAEAGLSNVFHFRTGGA